MPPAHDPYSLTSVYLVPEFHLYFLHQHLSGHTVLIYCLHMPKPYQYSLIRSIYILTNFLCPLYCCSSMHFFIPNSIHSWHSNQTSEALHLKNIHLHSVSSSHTPCLCYTQCLKELYFHIDTSWPLSPILYYSTLFSTPHALYTFHPCSEI